MAGAGFFALLLLLGGGALLLHEQEDFVAREWLQSAPPLGAHRVAVLSQFAPQGDGSHSIGVKSGAGWKKWTNLVTLSDGADSKWQLIWSRDGSLVALKLGSALLNDQSLKSALYSEAFDFRNGKNYRSNKVAPPAFSRQIEGWLKRRGGAITGRETRRKLSVWRRQDRNYKDAF